MKQRARLYPCVCGVCVHIPSLPASRVTGKSLASFDAEESDRLQLLAFRTGWREGAGQPSRSPQHLSQRPRQKNTRGPRQGGSPPPSLKSPAQPDPLHPGGQWQGASAGCTPATPHQVRQRRLTRGCQTERQPRWKAPPPPAPAFQCLAGHQGRGSGAAGPIQAK